MEETKFAELKEEILRRARAADACREQYGRAYESSTLVGLMKVIKDNFDWACRHDVMTVDIIVKYREEFAANDIYCNVDVERGFLLCTEGTVEAYGNATVKAYDSATVEAYDSATVEAYGNATVKAYDSATVEAYDSAYGGGYGNATVKAYDSATVEAYDSAYVTSYTLIECKLAGNALYRIRSSGEVRYVSDELKFVKI